MPIECRFDVCPVDQATFHRIDYEVMRHVFDVHNSFGRFCDEHVYQQAIVDRCLTSMNSVLTEVEIRVSHQSFLKSYFLDLVVNNGVVYELKTTNALVGRHQQQLINYLLLTGVAHGKLINFRPSSVEYRFVSSRLTKSDRHMAAFKDNGWGSAGGLPGALLDSLRGIVSDWGTHLDIELYKEALLHQLAASTPGITPVSIMDRGRVLGSQRLCLLDEQNGWHLSAVRDHVQGYSSHIQKLFELTNLSSYHWINMCGNVISLKTFRK